MTLFTSKHRLTVITVSGTELGRVSCVDIDEATGRIQTFFVASSHMIPRLMDRELSIAWEQVIDWKDDKLIVADTVVPVQAANIALAADTGPGAHLSTME